MSLDENGAGGAVSDSAVETEATAQTQENLIAIEEGASKEEGVGGEEQKNLINPEGDSAETKAEEEGAPDEYAAFNLPENFVFDGPAKDKVLATFKELNLSQGSAQKLMDAHVAFLQEFEADMLKGVQVQLDKWRNEVMSRQNYREEAPLVNKAVRTICTTEEEKALFKDAQLANNPAVWSMMVKVGQLLSEDTIGRGGGATGAAKRQYNINMETLN